MAEEQEPFKVHPQILKVLEGLSTQGESQAQAQQFNVHPDMQAVLDRLRGNIPAAEAIRQNAQEQASGVSNLQTPFIQMGGNIENRSLGAQNSLLQLVRSQVPDAVNISGFGKDFGLSTEPVKEIITGQIEKNREEFAANQMLLEALQDEAPKMSFLGDAVTFAAEIVMTGRQFKHANPKVQLAGRTAQEAAIGSLFGLTSVGMTDDQKEIIVSVGLATGALAPSLFMGAGRLISMRPETVTRVAILARLEKMFDKVGLLTLGEILGARGAKKFEAALDNIPLFFGLGGKRDAQRNHFRDMAESLVTAISRGKQGAPKDLVKGVLTRFRRFKKRVDRAYDNVAAELDRIRADPDVSPALRNLIPKVSLKNTQVVAQEMLNVELQLAKSVQNTGLATALKSFINQAPLSFVGARGTLSRLKELVRVERVQSAAGETTKAQLRSLVKLELALIDDMRLFGKSLEAGGATNVTQLLENANDQFRKLILPFYEAPVVRDIVSGVFNPRMDMDTVIGAFINSTRPLRSVSTQKLLPVKERQVAQYMILREALDKSTQGANAFFIRPEIFAAEIGSMSKLWGVTLEAEQREIISGFVTLAREGARAFTREGALGTLVFGGAAGMIGANKAGGGPILKFMATLLGAKWTFGTAAGTRVAKLMAQANNSKQIAAALHMAELGFTRYIEQNFPEFLGEAFPDEFEDLQFNVFTDIPKQAGDERFRKQHGLSRTATDILADQQRRQ